LFNCDFVGKTITVLSLILQTSGLSTIPIQKCSAEIVPVPSERAHEQVEQSDFMIFEAYWKEEITQSFREPALLKLLNNLGKVDLCHLLYVNIKRLKKMVERDSSNFKQFCAEVE
jgi:hypothetical protein